MATGSLPRLFRPKIGRRNVARGEHQEPEEAQPHERQAAERNKAVKSELKTRVATPPTRSAPRTTTSDVRLAVKRLDMAASKGVIHPNQAARRKSRLMKKVSASADGLTLEPAARCRRSPPRARQRPQRDRRATSTSITTARRASCAPQVEIGVASRSIARRDDAPPSRGYWSSALRAGNPGLIPSAAAAVGLRGSRRRRGRPAGCSGRGGSPSPAAGGARPRPSIRASSSERHRRASRCRWHRSAPTAARRRPRRGTARRRPARAG